MFSSKGLSQHTAWTPPFTPRGFNFSGLWSTTRPHPSPRLTAHCSNIVVAFFNYPQVLNEWRFGCGFTTECKQCRTAPITLVSLLTSPSPLLLLFHCRWVRQWSTRWDGHGGVQSTRGGVLRGGGDLELGRVHQLHLPGGSRPVRHGGVSTSSVSDPHQKQGHLLPRMPR